MSKVNNKQYRFSAEEKRLEESRQRRKHWKRWGPYLSERAWGTVREDYSSSGSAWDYFPHDHARSRAYRWNEDGLAGISDRHQLICFSVALWNGRDPILKERAFGLTGNEGNHGEDVKEYYFYLDSTPTHSFMRYLYKYPQSEFPYEQLIQQNRSRDKSTGEFELIDTGVFDENRYFDVTVEYAKADVEDLLIQISVANRSAETATVNVLPTIWFRNTWSWDHSEDAKPVLKQTGAYTIELDGTSLGKRWLYCDDSPELLFTENESNNERLFNSTNSSPYVKDSINDYVVHGRKHVVNPERVGTKAAANYLLTINGGATSTLRLRLSNKELGTVADAFTDFDQAFANRKVEAD